MKSIYIPLMPTTVHHIALTKTSLNLSGGEKAEIEIIDYLEREGFTNVIYTSETGKILFKQLKGFEKVEFVVVGPYWVEKINAFLAYYLRFIQLFFHLRRFPKGKNIIVTHDNFVPSSLYSLLLHWLNPRAEWILIYHMKCPGLFRGFLGEFTGIKYTPDLRLIRYWLEEQVTFLLVRGADRIVTVNEYNLSFLTQHFPATKIKVLKHFGGVDGDFALYADAKKQYDLVFMGRFHVQKGVLQLLDIVKEVSTFLPTVKVAVVGGGDEKLENEFKKEVERLGITSNISYLGYISDSRKYEVLQASRIFLFPSLYESFGIVAVEAMKCGLPVIAYDLPPFKVFTGGMVRVPVLDNKAMAEKIRSLLEDKKLYQRMADEALMFAKTVSWENTGREFSDLLSGMTTS